MDYSLWGHKESDMTERLNTKEGDKVVYSTKCFSQSLHTQHTSPRLGILLCIKYYICNIILLITRKLKLRYVSQLAQDHSADK